MKKSGNQLLNLNCFGMIPAILIWRIKICEFKFICGHSFFNFDNCNPLFARGVLAADLNFSFVLYQTCKDYNA